MPNPYGWGQNEPQIKPKDQGGDTISTFAAKIKDAITSLFNTLNSYPWSNATQSASGYMSKEDKTALDNVPTTYLPLSGGTLTGDITTKNIIMSSGVICRLADSQALYQYGGTGWQHGAQITLFGKDHSTNPGDFTIHADNGTNSCDLFGRPNGTLMWNGKYVEVVSAKSFGTSAYVYYKSGLQICCGYNVAPTAGGSGNTVTFPRAFKTAPFAVVSRRSGADTTEAADNPWIREPNATSMNIYVPVYTGYYWIAIGEGA